MHTYVHRLYHEASMTKNQYTPCRYQMLAYADVSDCRNAHTQDIQECRNQDAHSIYRIASCMLTFPPHRRYLRRLYIRL